MRSRTRLVLLAAGVTLLTGATTKATAATSQIKGEVHGPDGTPVPALVRLVSMTEGRPHREASTDRKGAFNLPLVEQGTYGVEIQAEGLRLAKVDVQVRNQGRLEDAYAIGPAGPNQPPELTVLHGKVVHLRIELSPEPGAANDPGAPFAEAHRLWSEKRYEESNAALDEHEKASPTSDPNAVYLRGLNAAGLRRLEEAEALFRRAIDMDPQLKGVRGQLAAMLHEKGNGEAAIALLAEELALDPGQVTVATNLAILQTQYGPPERAVEGWRKVLELDPGSSPAYQELARILTDLGRVEEAKEMLSRAEGVGRPDPAYWFNIGASLSNEDRFEEAEAAYRKAVAIDPAFPQAHREIGFLMLRKGETATAAEHLRTYLDAAPKAPDAAEVRDILKGLLAEEKK